MNQDYIKPDNWSIIEEGFDAERVKSSESLFSIGNGAMGQRANFEEKYSGATFQGSYIAGIYYPDKTKVGWWKNGYPEYFAKVLNAPNWIGIDIEINEETFDLNSCTEVKNFRRELNMKEGWYNRSFEATLKNGTEIAVNVRRFLSLNLDEVGIIKYEITPLNKDAKIIYKPYLDAGVTNEDANWEEKFWEPLEVKKGANEAYVTAQTYKTHFKVTTFMHNSIFANNENSNISPSEIDSTSDSVQFTYGTIIAKGQTSAIQKIGGYTVSLNHENTLAAAEKIIKEALNKGYDQLLQEQIDAWAKNLGNVGYYNRWRCKSTTGNPFQYFSVKSNLFRKRQPIEHWTKRFHRRKIRWFNLLGYRSLLHSVLYGDQRPTSCPKFIDLSLQPIG